MTIEQLHTRDRRAVGERRRRADDALAGRTVWCMTTLAAGDALAEALSACLAGVEGVGTERLRLQATAAEILELVAQMESMTGGTEAHRLRALNLEVSAAEPLRGVSSEDVVVVHDPLAAMLASGARERGAHVVWDETNEGVVVWRRVREAAAPADAHLTVVPGVGIAAVMAAPSRVAAKHCEDVESAGLGRVAALADIVRDDRDETVGGTLHARPAVAAR